MPFVTFPVFAGVKVQPGLVVAPLGAGDKTRGGGRQFFGYFAGEENACDKKLSLKGAK
jgi:hypothetical protein